MSNQGSGTFEIGLVMAGAISAGAYTAGVCDFLIQALDAWEAAKADPTARVPRHDVKIRALSGASAGAMTSAIAAVALASEVDPVIDPSNPPAPERNRFYDAWVRQIDIAKLLGTRDIKKKVVSLLDSTVLAEIAGDALKTAPRSAPRPYVDDPLAVMLSVANLRGVPYGFEVYGSDHDQSYGMFEHMDHVSFAVSWQGQSLPHAIALSPAAAPGGAWADLALAALASGAFPVGLAPRILSSARDVYAERYGRGPLWDKGGPSVRFLCVDGGLMNNEPLELARRHLAGPDQRNPQPGDQACRAVVMIDPFPNQAVFDESYEPNDGLLSVAGKMFGALINQARFKPEELLLAQRPDVYSRFMIAPSRPGASSAPDGTPAMASGILDGFGGFFHESFRRHDFQLGRRNCQAFLKWHFALPVTNKVFAGTDRALLDEWQVRDPNGAVPLFPGEHGVRVPFAPIIPLVGSAAEEVKPLPLPTGKAVDLSALSALVRTRVKKVGATIIERDLSGMVGWAVRTALATAWNVRYAGKVADKAIATVEKELARLP